MGEIGRDHTVGLQRYINKVIFTGIHLKGFKQVPSLVIELFMNVF